MDVVVGHEDKFGALGREQLENKLVLHRGAPIRTMRLCDVPAVGSVPPGSLAIPRFKVATICSAMQDVELHELHNVIHLGTAHTDPSKSHPVTTVGDDRTSVDEGSMSKQARKRKRRAERLAWKSSTNMTRGCWRREPSDARGHFYPDGVSLTDWQRS